MIDAKGFRKGVGIIIVNDRNQLFWAKRVGNNGWQFPQGGLLPGETPVECMYRELSEEVGLTSADVELLAQTKDWLYYYLPKRMIRYHVKPLCIGQKQKWFLLRLKTHESNFNFQLTDNPEFEGYQWVNYWQPLRRVIFFKRHLYRRALREFAPIVLDEPHQAVRERQNAKSIKKYCSRSQ